MTCPYCGKCLEKQKLTLSINKELIIKARKKGLNISKFLEDKINELEE